MKTIDVKLWFIKELALAIHQLSHIIVLHEVQCLMITLLSYIKKRQDFNLLRKQVTIVNGFDIFSYCQPFIQLLKCLLFPSVIQRG